MKRIIENKKNLELRQQASLHGKQIQGPPPSLNITLEQRKEFNKDALNLLSKLKERHKDGIKRSRTTDKN